VPAPPGRTDLELKAKAARLEARMDAHISPEGVLAYEHQVGAGPERLSHDVLALSDAAMWTGCYAGAMACRWRLTRDPQALARVRTLARGLALLSAASGRPGGLVRNVGRPLPGSAQAEMSEPSPLGQGYWVRGDPSRDQLAGVTFGWGMIGICVDDPEISALAREQSGAIARRLVQDGMWLRDLRGAKPEHGELRVDVPGAPFIKNGRFAAIGLAAVGVARRLDPHAQDLEVMWQRLKKLGWSSALPDQLTWLRELQSPSDAQMASLALATLFHTSEKDVADAARAGLGRIRASTIGWWNGGLCALGLLGGLADERPQALAELRAVLHGMPEEEVAYAHVVERKEFAIPTIWERGNSHWAWKDHLGLFRHVPPGTPLGTVSYTRADWLFAYWLGRAALALEPGFELPPTAPAPAASAAGGAPAAPHAPAAPEPPADPRWPPPSPPAPPAGPGAGR
jgi:hypothetical protein